MVDRVIALVDMDCFYCQVETKLNPDLLGIPMAVVQYNQWKQGGIIALSYEAKSRGVTRHMRGQEAKKVCPEIVLVTVPTVRDKADLTRYRDAGREVLSVLCKFSDVVERASVDEAYIDLTSVVEKRMSEECLVKAEQLKSTFVVGYSDNKSNEEDVRERGTENWLEDIFHSDIHDSANRKLAVGAVIVEELRRAVLDTTGFKCSAGLAHNKVLAKLACGLHKPNRQTVLPQGAVGDLFQTLPLRKIRSLGGKFGEEIEASLSCKFMGDLLKFTEKELKERFEEKTGAWLYNMAKGFESEPVQSRLVSKSIGCCKKFPGRSALASRKDVEHWLHKLTEELLERLLEDETMNKRRAQQMVVSVALEINKKDVASSKTVPLPSYNFDKIFNLAMSYLKKLCTEDSTLAWSPVIKYLGLSSGKFSNVGTKTISSFFKTDKTPCGKVGENELDESGSPSFFEKIFLKNHNGENNKPKLSLLPLLGKSRESDSDDSNSNWVEELPESDKENKDHITQDKTSKMTDYFAKGEEKPQTKPKVNTIETFFKETDQYPNPEEIFPDLNAVDDEMLAIFPPSFRRKVLELKKARSQNLPSTSNGIFDNSTNTWNNRQPSSDEQTPPPVPVEVDICENVDFKLCDECFQKVSVIEFEEHLDFHLATKLQKEINRMPAVKPIVRPVQKSPKKPEKRKSNERKENSIKKVQKIDHFFKK